MKNLLKSYSLRTYSRSSSSVPEFSFDFSVKNAKTDFWNDPVVQKQAFEQLERELNISDANLLKWKDVTLSMVRSSHIGDSLLKIHQGSLLKLLQNFRPSIDWNSSDFRTTSKANTDVWADLDKRRSFLQELTLKFNIKVRIIL